MRCDTQLLSPRQNAARSGRLEILDPKLKKGSERHEMNVGNVGKHFCDDVSLPSAVHGSKNKMLKMSRPRVPLMSQ